MDLWYAGRLGGMLSSDFAGEIKSVNLWFNEPRKPSLGSKTVFLMFLNIRESPHKMKET